MKTTSILELLDSRSGSMPVLISLRSFSSASELAYTARHFRRGALSEICGKSVTLRCSDIVNYIEVLIALDGWASRIMLVEEAISIELLNKYEGVLGIEFRITTDRNGIDINPLGRTNPKITSQTEWVIPTSGTTGEPKLIAHSFSTLTRSLKPPNDSSSTLRWGLLYNPTRFAALQVILQAILGGSCLIVPEQPADLEQSITVLRDNGCNALSATPSLWRKLAFSGMLDFLNLNLITLGGEAVDQKLLDVLRAHYPNATIRHIYASTEVGVGFSVADGKVGFPISYLHNPPNGVELKVRKDGMLLLRPPLKDQRILAEQSPLVDDEGWIASGDLVETGEDRCYFLGRINGSINVGGQKVHPSEIESVILETPGVVAVRVFAKSNPVLGSLVAAEIIAAQEIEPASLRLCILERCKKKLKRYKIPALILFCKEFELTSAGKIKR